MKLKEKEAGLADGPVFGKRSFGSGNGQVSLNDDRFDRSWRKTDAVDIHPQSAGKAENGHAGKAENGHAEEAENGNSEL